MISTLIFPAFLAGVLTFLAPCTLPIVPGYLSFISGVSVTTITEPKQARAVRFRILYNGVLYVLGFSLVFILLGSLFGLGGAALFQYRILLARLGGIFVIFFGLYLTGLLNFPFLNFLNFEKRLHLPQTMKPGHPASSFLFGATFAFGWSPCIGPILGSVLTLAASSTTVTQGAFLLSVFSLGLAVPFLLVAGFAQSAFRYVRSISRYVGPIAKVGGVFLVFLGILLVSGHLILWTNFAYKWFQIFDYNKLLKYY